MKTFLVVVGVVVFSAMAWASDSGVVRDGSGNLVESWSRKGNRIEIRDRDNNLIREISPSNSSSRDRFDVRDGHGDKIGEINRNRN
jgi:hypothetical protein